MIFDHTNKKSPGWESGAFLFYALCKIGEKIDQVSLSSAPELHFRSTC